jgi:hypothetical protein
MRDEPKLYQFSTVIGASRAKQMRYLIDQCVPEVFPGVVSE